MEQNKQDKDLETLQREFYNREAQKDLQAELRKQKAKTGAMIAAGALFFSIISYMMFGGIGAFLAIIAVFMSIFAMLKGGTYTKHGSMMCGISLIAGIFSIVINIMVMLFIK